MDFGKVLGEFWKAQIVDFRIFFDVFSKDFSNCISEGQKIEKKRPTKEQDTHFGAGLAKCAASGGEKKRGGEKPRH